jgi:hypothetical protein
METQLVRNADTFGARPVTEDAVGAFIQIGGPPVAGNASIGEGIRMYHLFIVIEGVGEQKTEGILCVFVVLQRKSFFDPTTFFFIPYFGMHLNAFISEVPNYDFVDSKIGALNNGINQGRCPPGATAGVDDRIALFHNHFSFR